MTLGGRCYQSGRNVTPLGYVSIALGFHPL